MAPDESVPDRRQVNLEGKPAKRGRIKYRKLFTKRLNKRKGEPSLADQGADSESEGKVISWLREHGIAFEAHGAIPHPNRFVDVNKLLEETLSRFSPEQRELLTAKLKLKRIENTRSVGRYDFKVEGINRMTRKRETYYIEYWGMYNPNIKITKETLRRLYNRLLVNYTFVKKPLKEKYYESLGLNLVSLTRADLRSQILDEKFGCLLNLDQDQLIPRSIRKNNEAEITAPNEQAR